MLTSEQIYPESDNYILIRNQINVNIDADVEILKKYITTETPELPF